MIVTLLGLAGLVHCSLAGFQGHASAEAFMAEHFDEWQPLLGIALEYGLPLGHEMMSDYLERMRGTCHKDEHCSDGFFTNLHNLYLRYEEVLKHFEAKLALRALIVKVAPKWIAKFGTKSIYAMLVKTASNPLGWGSDLAQLTLEVLGYKTAGKFIGAGGNIMAGVVSGFAVGGPSGALLGGTMGLGLWVAGEYLYYEHVEHLERGVVDFVVFIIMIT